nr:hypothetical protein [Tanacetum cinerariifolium]
SSSRHSSSDHSSPDLSSTSAGPSRKRHVEVDPRETRDERVTHPAMPEDILEPAQEGAAEVTYEKLGDLVQRFHDHTQAIPVYRIQTTEGIQREQGRRIVGVKSAVIALTERVAKLERDNQRLRGTASVESQRVDRLQRGMSRMQREMRQMRRFRFYDRNKKVRTKVMRMEETEEIEMEITEEMETEEMEMKATEIMEPKALLD